MCCIRITQLQAVWFSGRITQQSPIQQQQFEYAYIYGAVCTNTGEVEAIVSPVNNMEAMREHLKLISDATPVGKHSVIVMDPHLYHTFHLDLSLRNRAYFQLY